VAEKSKKPEVRIHLLLGTHLTAEEAEFIREPFQKCDIFIPEAVERGHSDQEEFFNQISQGCVYVDKFFELDQSMLPFEIREFEIMSGSQKMIWVCDIPYYYVGDGLAWLKEGGNYCYPGTFENALSALEEDIRICALAQRRRERYIVQNIRWRIRALLRTDEEMRQKKGLNILMFMGSFHTNVGHQLAKKFQFTRTFHTLPLVYPPVVEVMRRFAFGKTVDQEMLAQIFLSEYFATFFCSLSGRKKIFTYALDAPMLAWVRKLNVGFEEIKALWSPRAGGITKRRLKNFLLARGHQIPKTTEELKNLFLPQR